MLTQTRDVSTSFWIVSEKPDKMAHSPVVIPAINRLCASRHSIHMYLFCLAELLYLAEG
jgi:hypothetical protein